MTGSCRLNNMMMRNLRRSNEYQALVADLTLLGVISKEECEMLLGSALPSTITLPNGSHGTVVSEDSDPKDITPETEVEE